MLLTRKFFIHATIVLTVLAGAMMLGALLFIYWGVYNVAAVQPHTQPVYWVLDVALNRSIRARAAEVEVPPLVDAELIQRGFLLFRDQCVQCHGAPGVAPEEIGKGMVPLPNNLVQTARERSPAEIYWVTKKGIKMTGMPAWEFRFSDEDIWAIVAFVERLPTLSPKDYRVMEQGASDASQRGHVSASGTF